MQLPGDNDRRTRLLVFRGQPQATSFCRKCVCTLSSRRRTSPSGFRRLLAKLVAASFDDVPDRQRTALIARKFAERVPDATPQLFVTMEARVLTRFTFIEID